MNKKKSKSSKKRKRTIHHQRGYSDSVHNPANYTMISHHKRGSSGSGSSGNQWKKLFQTEAFEDCSDTINILSNTSDLRHKTSYDGTGTVYTNESNYKQESTTKHITKTRQQPSQAAIVTTTTTITTTPLQKYISGKHGKRSSSNLNKRCYDNVTQKRKWMIKEFNRSKDLDVSEVKDTEESKVYSKMNNSSIQLEQKSNQMLLKSKSNSMYKTHERMGNKNDNSFYKSDVDESDILGGPTTLKRKQWKIKYSLKWHLDAVRSLYFNMNMNILASASEDRTIRLWKADTFTGKEVEDDHIAQPQIVSYMTLRGHSDPLLTMAGPGDTNQHANKKILYSAGVKGDIRVWKIPSPLNFDSIESTHENQHCIGVWNHHKDAVWDLQHHPTENWILSVSADKEIVLWMTPEENESIEYLNIKKQRMSGKILDTPTTCCWLGANATDFACGFISPNLIIFDANTGAKKSFIKYQTQKYKTMEEQQPNRIIFNSFLNLMVSGHEDKEIKLFDVNSNTCIKSFVGHTDSVSALANTNSGYYLLSGGHDGSLRCWDIRKQQCLYDIPAHRKKYDEGIHFIASHPSESMFASCGADSNIKIFLAPHLGVTDNEVDNSYQNSFSFKH